MKTYIVTTEATVERMYTVKACSEEEAKKKALAGDSISLEESDTNEEVQLVNEEEE